LLDVLADVSTYVVAPTCRLTITACNMRRVSWSPISACQTNLLVHLWGAAMLRCSLKIFTALVNIQFRCSLMNRLSTSDTHYNHSLKQYYLHLLWNHISG
jgi:hypothetical protein